ncbi:MAG: S1C family serine protease [Patescibacteria group bacterium]
MDKIKIKSIDEGMTAKSQVPINLMLKNHLGARWILVILLSFIFGGFGGILADRYLFPYLIGLSQFEKYKFLQPAETKIIIKKEESLQDNFSELVKKVRPYIVSIASRDELTNFFGRTNRLKSGGQGVILTSDGIILTTRAVVQKQTNFLVVFSDGKNYETDKIFFDPASDLVFLKIKADNLPAVEMASFDDLFLGQKALIFKDLFINESENVVFGTVTSLDKKDNFKPQEEKLDSFVLVQADLNKFSYGGPVFDVNGKMIGVINKVGKALEVISSDDINIPLSDLIKNKKIERVKLGIKYFPVTPDFAYFKNLSKSQGIFLPQYAAKDSVEKGGPADRTGILPGDLIYEINGREIKGTDTYFRLLQEKNKGDEIEISYLRKDKEYKTKAVLEER